MTAVERAARTAADAGARLLLVCAYYPGATREQAARAAGVLGRHPLTDRDAANVLARAHHHARAAAAAVEPETVAVAARPGEGLLEVAAEQGAEAIVVGDRGLSRVAGRILGSVPTPSA